MGYEYTHSEHLDSEKDWYHIHHPGVWHHDKYYDTSIMKVTNIQDPQSSSRAKPENLLANLTGHGPAWRFTSDRGLYKSVPPYHRYSRGKHSWTTWYYPWGPTAMPSFPASSVGATKHLLKLRGLTNDVSGLVAELNKTVDGFAHAAHQVGRIVRKVRDVRRGRFTLRDVATTHLAVQYGIKPVVNDLYTVVDGLHRINEERIHRVTSTTKETQFLEAADGALWKVNYSNRRISYVKVKQIAGISNYNIGNPVEWGWELIPFSFVVDWFLPIGDYIAASYADRGLQMLGGTLTRKISARWFSDDLGPGYVSHVPPKATFESYARTTTSGFEPPDKVELTAPKSLTTLGNAVALLKAIRG